MPIMECDLVAFDMDLSHKRRIFMSRQQDPKQPQPGQQPGQPGQQPGQHQPGQPGHEEHEKEHEKKHREDDVA